MAIGAASPLLRRHVAAMFSGTALGAAYYYSRVRARSHSTNRMHSLASKRSLKSMCYRRVLLPQPPKEGEPSMSAPQPPPGVPAKFLADGSLVIDKVDTLPSFATYDGLWLAWYNGPMVLRLFSTPSALRGQHLTGNLALPPGAAAFELRRDAAGVAGLHFGSGLPFNLMPNSTPCRLNSYHADASQRAVDASSLSLDVSVGPQFLHSMLPPVRVPLRRLPDAAAAGLCDADGYVRSKAALEKAREAVAVEAAPQATGHR